MIPTRIFLEVMLQHFHFWKTNEIEIEIAMQDENAVAQEQTIRGKGLAYRNPLIGDVSSAAV